MQETNFQETPQDFIIRPVVLLSVVDHYKRTNAKRVMGVLLGEFSESTVIVSNSFALPFEENEDCWFYDTSYLENMLNLCYKANPMDKVIGWYQTSKVMMKEDKNITASFKKYTTFPLMVNIDVNATSLPVKCYKLKDNALNKVPMKIEAGEAEEVGVEHLLKNYHDQSNEYTEINVSEIRNSLVSYESCLTKIIESLDKMETEGICMKKLNAFHDCLNSVEKCKSESEDLKKLKISSLIKEVATLSKELTLNQ